MSAEQINALATALSALAALVAVLLAGLTVREMGRIEDRADLRDANDRDDKFQGRLDPMLPGLYQVLGKTSDEIPSAIRSVLMPFYVLYSDAFAAHRDNLLGSRDNTGLLDEFAFFAQRPAARSAWTEFRSYTWPEHFRDHVDRVMLAACPYGGLPVDHPPVDWPVTVREEVDGDLGQLSEVLVRVRETETEFPPSSIDLPGFASIDSDIGRAQRRKVYREWLRVESAQRRRQWAAVMGHRSVGLVQVTDPHKYLVDYLQSHTNLGITPDTALEIGHLFVDPQLTGLGIGKDLVNEAMTYIAAVGKIPILVALPASKAAVGLYAHVGLRQIGQLHGKQGINIVMSL
jgi:GNAT superfamily N-acetyltransferase